MFLGQTLNMTTLRKLLVGVAVLCAAAGCSSSNEEATSVAVTEVAAETIYSSGCSERSIPAPDGMGCPDAEAIVADLVAPVPGGIDEEVQKCMKDRFQNISKDSVEQLRAGIVFDCEAFNVLGVIDQKRLKGEGGDEQIDCLGDVIESTGAEVYEAAAAAGSDSSEQKALDEQLLGQCP